jgi:hypothetical protein
MAEKRPSFLGRFSALRHGLSARFTALFLVMALIVAATGTFGISKIALVGGTVQEMVRTRAAQEKMAVLMKSPCRSPGCTCSRQCWPSGISRISNSPGTTTK